MREQISYIISQTGLWIEFWSIISILFLIFLVIYFVIKHRNFIRKEEELQDLIENKNKNNENKEII